MSRVKFPSGLLVLALATVIAGVAGWFLGSSTSSAEEIDSDSPATEVLAVPVEYRELVDALVTRAVIVPNASLAVGLGAPPMDGRGVVTAAPLVGTLIENGAVALEVDGHPVIVLEGTRPMYRTIGSGDYGPDVDQLQVALADLGYGEAVTPAVFDTAMKTAVVRFFVESGYEPPIQSPLAGSRRDRALDAWAQLAKTPKVSDCESSSNEAYCDAVDRLVDIYVDKAAEIRLSHPQILFIEMLPARVVQPVPEVGEPAAALHLAQEGYEMSVSVATASAQRVSVGDTVTVDEEASGLEASGTVTSIRNDEADPGTGVILVRFDDGAAQLVGRSVRVTIPFQGTDGPVTAVPTSAIHMDAKGDSSIELLRPDDTTVWIDVTVGVEAGGWAEVTPTSGEIPNEAWVVIGQQSQ